MAFSVSGRLLFAGYDDSHCRVSPPLRVDNPRAWVILTLMCRSGMFSGAKTSAI